MKMNFWNSVGLTILCIFVSRTDEYEDYDVSDDESLLYKYYQYKKELKWRWSVHPFCRVVCNRTLGLSPQHTYVETREFLYASLDCMKTEVDILNCACNLRHPNKVIRGFFSRDYYVSGLNGEIYDVRHASGRCGEDDTLHIFERIIGSEDTTLRPPRLWGVGRLSQALDARRTPWRQWNRDRISGKIPNSSSSSSEGNEYDL